MRSAARSAAFLLLLGAGGTAHAQYPGAWPYPPPYPSADFYAGQTPYPPAAAYPVPGPAPWTWTYPRGPSYPPATGYPPVMAYPSGAAYPPSAAYPPHQPSQPPSVDPDQGRFPAAPYGQPPSAYPPEAAYPVPTWTSPGSALTWPRGPMEEAPPAGAYSGVDRSGPTYTDAAAAPYPGGPGRPRPNWATAILQAHNAVRARVGVPPLVWSDQLASVAQQWADHLVAHNAFSHRPDNRFGENLYTIAGGSASPTQVVSVWADEARHYDIRSNACSAVCGHYTQIVWRQTRAVGCAMAGAGYREVWVCNYDPAGNVVGYRPY
jgi:pathogenesis-related protein 1